MQDVIVGHKDEEPFQLPHRLPTAGDLRKAREKFYAAGGITLKRAAEAGKSREAHYA
ncbi:MAG: hypothetical protein LBU06_09120 [Desulfovibrio sp.]|jgi:hypothetical protein|nr:hypothetical protein [Desulfovibrio sp.]